MRSVSVRRGLALALVLALVLAPLPAAAQLITCLPSPAPPFVDNRDGHFVNYEEAPNHPMELSWDGKRLYVTNLPDARISVFDINVPGNPVLIDQIAVGLGPVTVRRRPAQPLPQPLSAHGPTLDARILIGDPHPVPVDRHLWVVCMSSNALFIIDEVTRRVVDSVRLPHRPSGLVFDAGGQFAYVTLSDSNRIAKLNANNPHAAPTFLEFDSEMPLGTGARVHVEEPRALLRDGSTLYALSFLSGNGTTGVPAGLSDSNIENQWNFPAGNPAPSDRDVLHFDLGAASPQGSAALWRMGTLNFDLARRQSTGRLYVSTVNMVNEDEINEGEPQYRANGFAVHAVSHALPSAGGTPQTGTVTVDLNDPSHHAATLRDDFRCAVPTDLLFTSDGSKLYAACYETRNVALLDAASDQVLADFAALPAGAGFGLRGLALAPGERWLYAYGRGDNTLLVFDTRNPPVGAAQPTTAVLPLGFDITPKRVLSGRFQFLNAANSGDGLSTCNTCHMDGHLDGIAWDLSDFTGDLESNPKDVPRVPKGAKVTMSLLGIEETPPFHWRGDRADLDAFNPAFAGLLGGSELDEAPGGALDQFLAFVFSLSYPPSPHQPLDRGYSGTALAGFDCFTTAAVHDVSKDTAGGLLQPSCEGCHSMAGASGTLNQVNNPIIGLLADDATQLRGLWDKTSDTVNFAPVITCPDPPTSNDSPYCNGQLTQIPATGWGLANTGFVDTSKAFVGLGVFHLGALDENRIVQFMNELDTGSAPTTAATHQLDGTLPATPPYPSPVQELIDGANPATGHDNDLIARGWILHQGVKRAIGMLYDPAAQLFVTDTLDNPAAGCTAGASATPGANGIGPFTLAQLDQMAGAGNAELALAGTPVGSGYRLGLDREMDCLRDGDEAAHGASTLSADTDRDTYPDGYEVRLGSLPNNPASTPTDGTAPSFGSGSVAWFNSNVAKARWSTDEESKSRIRVYDQTSSGEVLVYEDDEPQFKRAHVMVARKLQPGPGHTYRAEVEAEDPSGNRRTLDLGLVTLQPHMFLSAHLAATTLTRLATNPNGTERYRAEFQVVGEDGQSLAGAMVRFALVEWIPGAATTQFRFPLDAGPSGGNGIAALDFDGVKQFAGAHGFAEAFAFEFNVSPVTFPAPSTETRLYFHSLDGQFGHWDQEELNPPP